MSYHYLMKFLLCGGSRCGKSSFLSRLTDQVFTERYVGTIGVDVKTRTLDAEGKTLQVQIWDTAGAERFRAILESYLRSCQGYMVCYAVTDRASFNDVGEWIARVRGLAKEGSVMMLLGLKSDAADEERQVALEEAEEYAAQMGLSFFEASAKTGHNVDEAFAALVMELVDLKEGADAGNMVVTLNGADAHCVTCSSLDGSELLRLNVDAETKASAIVVQLSKDLGMPQRKLTLLLPSGAVLSKDRYAEPVVSLLLRDAEPCDPLPDALQVEAGPQAQNEEGPSEPAEQAVVAASDAADT